MKVSDDLKEIVKIGCNEYEIDQPIVYGDNPEYLKLLELIDYLSAV